MKVIIISLLIVVSVTVGWGPPTVNAVPDTDFTWKTYVNTKNGYSVEYPTSHDLSMFYYPKIDMLNIDSVGLNETYYAFVLKVDLFNFTKYKDLKSLVESRYNLDLTEAGYIALSKVDGTEFINYPTYTYTVYAPGADPKERIFKVAYQLHDGKLYTFSLSDIASDFHEEDFDWFVNSFKIFQ
jgi:hypothetical protein